MKEIILKYFIKILEKLEKKKMNWKIITKFYWNYFVSMEIWKIDKVAEIWSNFRKWYEWMFPRWEKN